MIHALTLAGLLATTTAVAAETERFRIDIADGGRLARLTVSRGATETRWLLVCSDATGSPASRSTRAGTAPTEADWVMGEDRSPTGGRFTLALRPSAPLFMATAGLDGCPRAGVPTIRRLAPLS